MRIKVRPKLLKIITFGWASAITLWPFGIYLALDRYLNNKELINHESIHWMQSREMLGIFFYLFYGLEWVVKIFMYGKKAYINLSFEREAHANQNNLNYLNTRKRFAWLKYL